MNEEERQGIRNLNKIFNQAFQNIIDRGLIDQEVLTPKKFLFPDGLRYKYWKRFKRKPKYKKWMFCYSSTKNGNGKYASWIYWPIQDEWKIKRFVEHRLKRQAIDRAYHLYENFK